MLNETLKRGLKMLTALALVLLVMCATAAAQSEAGIGGGKPKAKSEGVHGGAPDDATKKKTDEAHYGTASATTTMTAAAAPKVGEAAPDFKLPYATQEKIFMKPDEQLSLSAQRGKNVILAFYPADWSGGCTTEVCTLRDTFAELAKLNATVLAVSGDYVFSHQEWAKHHNLQFPLLSDHDHHVAKMYDSFMDGVGFNKRTIYLIDKDGMVRYVNLAFKAGDKKDYDALRAELEKLK
ncbi:MAG: thioredoxin-dependent peroxiredoxin [Acidobacteriota bacterium]|jgi:peroxiredoxin|nr:thioredoxin-dependent peroxiredoxin [Acidobacteriota bacterium]MDT7806476.1 thioredoxin-dependent peroxiredoxin [Acidobacteriota bacterium]